VDDSEDEPEDEEEEAEVELGEAEVEETEAEVENDDADDNKPLVSSARNDVALDVEIYTHGYDTELQMPFRIKISDKKQVRDWGVLEVRAGHAASDAPIARFQPDNVVAEVTDMTAAEVKQMWAANKKANASKHNFWEGVQESTKAALRACWKKDWVMLASLLENGRQICQVQLKDVDDNEEAAQNIIKCLGQKYAKKVIPREELHQLKREMVDAYKATAKAAAVSTVAADKEAAADTAAVPAAPTAAVGKRPAASGAPAKRPASDAPKAPTAKLKAAPKAAKAPEVEEPKTPEPKKRRQQSPPQAPSPQAKAKAKPKAKMKPPSPLQSMSEIAAIVSRFNQ
jgi:hypothetical protein